MFLVCLFFPTEKYKTPLLRPPLGLPKSGVVLILNIGIKHGFSCINIRQVPREMLKTEAGGHGFQHLPRDLANFNA